MSHAARMYEVNDVPTCYDRVSTSPTANRTPSFTATQQVLPSCAPAHGGGANGGAECWKKWPPRLNTSKESIKYFFRWSSRAYCIGDGEKAACNVKFRHEAPQKLGIKDRAGTTCTFVEELCSNVTRSSHDSKLPFYAHRIRYGTDVSSELSRPDGMKAVRQPYGQDRKTRLKSGILSVGH